MKKSEDSRSTLGRVVSCVGEYKFLIALSVFLSAVSVVLSLYIPILAGKAIDLMTGENAVDFKGISVYLIRIAVCIVLAAIMQWVTGVINNRITYNTVRDIREKAFAHIQRLPVSYIDGHRHGDIVSRIIADADQFADGLLLGFSQLFTGAVTILVTLLFMLSVSPIITAAVVVLTPISLFTARFIAKTTYNLFRRQSEIRGEQTAYINEAIQNLKLIKAFSFENNSNAKFNEINDRLEDCSIKSVFFSSVTNPSTRFINSVVYAVVALTGALSAIYGGMTVGGLACLLSYANQYTKPFNEISGVITELQNAIACAARIFELIDTPALDESSAVSADTEKFDGRITFDNVSFSYRPDVKLIENFDLNVKSGNRIAIVGPTGCGKTTVINLLMRFYDVNSGSIKISDVDIREITRRSLRKNYGMVLQETWLKDGTVKENIAYGRPDADFDEIVAAAKASHAHGFIKRLENGYDTVIGEGRGNLSEGQRQLLCIARVMLCKPKILILDEATSSIDTRTELKIQDAFSTLMEGRTSFIVAHRLSTIKSADVILVMKNGHIIEKGTHDELIKLGGFYKNLYESQFAY